MLTINCYDKRYRWYYNKVRVAPEMYSWLTAMVKLVLGYKILDRYSLRRHPAADALSVGRGRTVSSPPRTLHHPGDLGTMNKLPHCLFDLHTQKKNLHADFMI